MEEPFIYKYQPIKLNDFKIDSKLTELLKTLIEMNSLNLLFIGDSGSGKSSLIQSIIKHYYSNTNFEKNILTINNLKEQGISYYRHEVKTFCQTASLIPGKKKILLLDDIDFIHEHSQQVFRNYIDKYSDNVHFIASCSNTQKVIESLQSRMNIIKIKPPNKSLQIKILEHICSNENIHITPQAKEFLILISNNSVRILINYLEKIKLFNQPINIKNVSTLCTNLSFYEFEQFTITCKEHHDLTKAINILYKLHDSGFSVVDILDNYFIYLKTTSILDEKHKYNIIPFLCKYITYFYQIHEDYIELALFTNNLIEYFKK